ncbi:glycosyltransferase [Chloroflexota bacterium]
MMERKNILDGVSVIIPAYNAANTLGKCLESAIKQKWLSGYEIIVVNDGSKDKTKEIALSFPDVQVINTINGGASKATNIGINKALYGIVVSLDADAVLADDWLEKIMPHFADQSVAAVGGYAITGNKSIIGKLMGYDVELRLDSMPNSTDHLYTMNTAYRREALIEIGLFDEEMNIGYDVDISRRLKATGYKLILQKDAKCTHYWRDDLKGYLNQQYNYAYYRLNIREKFKKSSDNLVSLGMILHVPFTAVIILVAIIGSLVSPWMLLSLLILPILHLPETIKLLTKRRELVIFALPLVFTIRNIIWTWALLVWGFKHIPNLILLIRRK